VSVETLAHEALERALDYDDSFVREVEAGLSQVEDGQTMTHETLKARLAKKLSERETER
jgi:predicted transcriptional regulator